MTSITGGCLCGSVRYTATAEPVVTFLCHCRACQRYTGSAFEAGLIFPIDSVPVQGNLATFAHSGGSSQTVSRRFCPKCGSGVVNVLDAIPGSVIVLAGTLDDPAQFAPMVEVFCRYAQPWVTLEGERQRFVEGRDSTPFR